MKVGYYSGDPEEAKDIFNEMIRGLTSDYNAVFMTNLDTGRNIYTYIESINAPSELDPEKIFSEENMKNRFCSDFDDYHKHVIHPDDYERFKYENSKEYIAQQLELHDVFFINYRMLVNGEYRYCQTKISRTHNYDETHNYVVGVKDIDKSFKDEIAYKKKLEDALKKAEESNIVKRDFLFQMSHDLRTPMNSILGFVDLALSHSDDIELAKSYLQNAKMSGQYMLNLVNDILTMAKTVTNEVELKEENVDINEFIKSIENQVQNLCKERNHTFKVKIGRLKNKNLIFDSVHSAEVILNIINNSIKYTARGGKITLEVKELKYDIKNQCVYEFTVTDNGCGMTKEELGKIFEPFYRAKTTTESGICGIGLGMTICKKLVSKMGGDIKIESKVEKGTKVIIKLPFKISSAPKIQEKVEEVSYASLKNKRLLIVEDNEFNQLITQTILKDYGVETDVACDGYVALKMLQNANYQYDGILMDIQMPNMNGYDTTVKIREMKGEYFSKIPIIGISANTYEEDIAKALNSGMNDYLTKPIDTKQMLNLLVKII